MEAPFGADIEEGRMPKRRCGASPSYCVDATRNQGSQFLKLRTISRHGHEKGPPFPRVPSRCKSCFFWAEMYMNMCQ